MGVDSASLKAKLHQVYPDAEQVVSTAPDTPHPPGKDNQLIHTVSRAPSGLPKHVFDISGRFRAPCGSCRTCNLLKQSLTPNLIQAVAVPLVEQEEANVKFWFVC